MKSWLGMLRLSRSRNMPVHYTTLDERAVARVRAWRLGELLFCVVFRCEDVNRQRLGSARPNVDGLSVGDGRVLARCVPGRQAGGVGHELATIYTKTIPPLGTCS